MAEYQITYWRDLPSLVTAREGDEVAKIELPAAVPGADRPGRDGRGPDRLRRVPGGLAARRVDAGEGSPAELAAAVAARLDAEHPA